MLGSVIVKFDFFNLLIYYCQSRFSRTSSAIMSSETAKNMGPDGLIPGAIHPVPGTPR